MQLFLVVIIRVSVGSRWFDAIASPLLLQSMAFAPHGRL
jgi:hypothetical protein